MSKGYVGGENQNSEAAKKQIANFAEAAKGMGFALGIIATGEKAVNLGKNAIENATVTTITADDAWGAREGEQVVNLDGATISFLLGGENIAVSGEKGQPSAEDVVRAVLGQDVLQLIA